MKEFSLDLLGLSKPGTALIERVSDFIGGALKPHQIKRVAKAEAAAEKYKAISKFETTQELEQRALNRFVQEEINKQSNMENIAQQAATQVKENATPEKIEKDWLADFFDSCRIISDKEMQSLWAKILAGEANEPGKFSKRTIAYMVTLDKKEAELFTKLCGFVWEDMKHDPMPFICDYKEKIYTDNGINFKDLKHLDTIGLINFDSLAGYQIHLPGKQTIFSYHGIPYLFRFPNEKSNDLKFGHVILTTIGEELTNICMPPKINGFESYIIEEFKKQNVQVIGAAPTHQ